VHAGYHGCVWRATRSVWIEFCLKRQENQLGKKGKGIQRTGRQLYKAQSMSNALEIPGSARCGGTPVILALRRLTLNLHSSCPSFLGLCVCVCVILGFELRASRLLGRCSTTWALC
jgi:hypothetical protein